MENNAFLFCFTLVYNWINQLMQLSLTVISLRIVKDESVLFSGGIKLQQSSLLHHQMIYLNSVVAKGCIRPISIWHKFIGSICCDVQNCYINLFCTKQNLTNSNTYTESYISRERLTYFWPVEHTIQPEFSLNDNESVAMKLKTNQGKKNLMYVTIYRRLN